MVWGAAPSLADGGTERNKALARRIFDPILNKGKYELRRADHEGFRQACGWKDVPREKEIEDAKGMRDASSDLVMTIDQMIAEGDRVAVLTTGRGTGTGPLQGMPPTG